MQRELYIGGGGGEQTEHYSTPFLLFQYRIRLNDAKIIAGGQLLLLLLRSLPCRHACPSLIICTTTTTTARVSRLVTYRSSVKIWQNEL